MDEQMLEFLSWVARVVGANWPEIIALIFSGWALRRSFRAEKRDLIKERDDLLDIALKTNLTLTDIHVRALPILVAGQSEFSDHQIQNLRLLDDNIRGTAQKIWEYHSKLKTAKPSADLIDSISHPLREQAVFAENSIKQFLEDYMPTEGAGE